MNKKASIEDGALLAIFLVVLMIFAYPIVQTFIDIDDAIQNTDELGSDSKSVSSDFNTNLPKMLEGIYLFLILGGYGATIVLAFLIDTHPAFFLGAAIFFTAMILVIPFIVNAADDVADSEGFAGANSQFKIIPFVLNNYLQITIVLWVTIGIALYSKRAAIT